MYTSLDTLPDNVRSSLEVGSQKQWMAAYNKAIKTSAAGNHRRAIYEAWNAVKNNPDCRFFACYASSSRVDRQNDSVNVDAAYEKIQKQIERGGTIVDTHSNRVVGSFYYAERRRTPSGHPGVYAYGVIMRGEPYFDSTWEAILKAVECPSCKDVRKGVSIGGFALDTSINCDGSSCHRDILDLSIHEISVCREPANPDALISEINLLAKSDSISINGENMNKMNTQGDFDPRANELPEMSGDELSQEAQAKAQAMAGQEEPPASLGNYMQDVSQQSQEEQFVPTVDEIKAFSKKIKNIDRIIREVEGIKRMLDGMGAKQPAAEPAVEDPMSEGPVQKAVAPAGAINPALYAKKKTQELEDAQAQRDKNNARTSAVGAVASGIDSATGAIKDMASGNLMAGMNIARGALSSTGQHLMNQGQKKDAQMVGQAKQDAKDAEDKANNYNANLQRIQNADKNKASGVQSASANTASSTAPVNVSKACDCAVAEGHTRVDAKRCPIDEKLYGDIGDPAESEFLENKEIEKETFMSKEEGMPDAVTIKGKKTATEGPASTTKTISIEVMGKELEKAQRILDDMLKNLNTKKVETDPETGFKETKNSTMLNALSTEEEEEEVAKCGCSQKEADEVPEGDIDDGTEDAIEKCRMTQEQFKAKYAPKKGKSRFKPSKIRIKRVGKEGSSVLMKMDFDFMNGAEDVEEESEEPDEEISASELIAMMVDFLNDNGFEVSVEQEMLDHPEIEEEIEKEPELTDEEIEVIANDPEEVRKAETLGNMMMLKFRMRMAENRLNMQTNNVLEYLL